MSLTQPRLGAELKLPIAGSATPDSAGALMTRAAAQRHARRAMPSQLQAAGYEACVVGGQEMHDGAYRPCWRLSYQAPRAATTPFPLTRHAA